MANMLVEVMAAALVRSCSKGRPLGLVLALGFGLASVWVLAHYQKLALALGSWNEITVIALTPPLALIVAFLFVPAASEAHASASEFWMRQLADMYGQPGGAKADAVKDLMDELAKRRTETDYLHDVVSDIAVSSVWAVCGRKTNTIATTFWDANCSSRIKGHYIERVFFPPADRAEASGVHTAIERHLDGRMIARVLREEHEPDAIRLKLSLPPGFGMTLMGTPRVAYEPGLHDPESITKVLVHWGGVDGKTDHFGVILTARAMIDVMVDLFMRIRVLCDFANEGHVAPGEPHLTIQQFLKEHKRYRRPRISL